MWGSVVCRPVVQSCGSPHASRWRASSLRSVSHLLAGLQTDIEVRAGISEMTCVLPTHPLSLSLSLSLSLAEIELPSHLQGMCQRPDVGRIYYLPLFLYPLPFFFSVLSATPFCPHPLSQLSLISASFFLLLSSSLFPLSFFFSFLSPFPSLSLSLSLSLPPCL